MTYPACIMLCSFSQFLQTSKKGGIFLLQNLYTNAICLQLLLHIQKHISCTFLHGIELEIFLKNDKIEDKSNALMCTDFSNLLSLSSANVLGHFCDLIIPSLSN